MTQVAFPAPDTRLAADRAGLSKSSPGRPRSTIGNRRRQRLEGQPAGQRRFDTRWPSSRFASIASMAPGQRHHGDMRWPRRPRRVVSLTPHGRQFTPAREAWWGRRISSEPGFVLSPGGWTPPPGVLPAWNWLPSEGAAPRLDLVPWWARVWYHLPFIDRYAHTWMWRHGAWEVRPPDTELGHIGGTD
jgi:hypothetical protein